jgi:asparagine synthase (glutamine-hydrolysing)
MCGIAGLLSETQFSEAEQILLRMASAISHRGPNDSGVWASRDEGVYLAHRRLSILDVSSAGHQPMISKSSRYVISFNGEIYNHLELRKKLSNVSWFGHSDTETVLVCFEEWGVTKTLDALSGMFAIALWDRKLKKLILARDRFGEKPLYYGNNSRFFFFASELKALREFPYWQPKENPNSVALLLRHAYIPSPLTIYENVYKLPAGSYLEVSFEQSFKVLSKKWFNYDEIGLRVNDFDAASDQQSLEMLETVLTNSVRNQMLSDVPIGAMLSGGVDSSLIVSVMQSISKNPVKTFTVGFSESKYDESFHAKAVAKHLGTDHSEIHVTPRDAINVIPKLSDIYDEPFADSSQIPAFLISQFASQRVSVCLSGDGADEIFGGYNRYLVAPAIWRNISVLPRCIRTCVGYSLKHIPNAAIDGISILSNKLLPAKFRVHNLGEKVTKVGNSLGAKNFDDFYASFLAQWHGQLPLMNEVQSSVYLNDPSRWPLTSDLVQKMMTVDAMTYLTDDILVKVDRASMAVGLEVRAPYLNEEVISFAATCRPDQKIRGGQGKWLLREMLSKYVPNELINRPKQGFGVPIEYWLRGPLRDWAEDLLSVEKLGSKGILDPKPIRKLWHEHLSGKNHQYALWNVLMYQSWSDRWD